MSVLFPSSPHKARAGWLFHPVVDLLLGCGLIYVLIVGLLFLWQPKSAQINPWLPILILLTGIPHYGATLLRVRATEADRRRYFLPFIIVSISAIAIFIAGLRSSILGSIFITLYLTWSPWHYAAQNYGITMMFLRRRDVAIETRTRRLLRASFVSSFLLVLLSYHQPGAGAGYDPLYAASAAFRFRSIGIPFSFLRVATPLLLLIHISTLGIAVGTLLRKSGLRAIVPAIALLFSQAVWFSLPALVMLGWPGLYPGSRVALAFVWIAVGHCVQYLWISTYFHRIAAKQGRGVSTTLFYLLRVTLIGAAVWVVPALLFAPGALGRIPFDAGLGLLIAAAVNLHHFAMDAVIWRLREPRVRSLLIDGQEQDVARRHASGPPSITTCALIVVGGMSILIWISAAWEREVGHRRAFAQKDLERLAQASARLTAMGRDGPQIHIALARLKQREGRLDESMAELRQSLRLQATAAAWHALARVHRLRGEVADSEAAERAAQELESDGARTR